MNTNQLITNGLVIQYVFIRKDNIEYCGIIYCN